MEQNIQDKIDSLNRRNKKFTLKKSGNMYTFIIEGYKKKLDIFNGKFDKKVGLISANSRHVRTILENGFYMPKNEDENRPDPNLNYINFEQVKKSIGLTIAGIDINNCYYNTALQLGIVNPEYWKNKTTYNKMQDKDNKLLRNTAIGSLGKTILEFKYENGKLIESLHYKKDTNVVRLDILDRLHEVTEYIIKELNNDFLFSIVDCYFVKKSAEKKVYDIIKKFNYECKTKDIIITGLDEGNYQQNLWWRLTPTPDDYKKDSNCFFNKKQFV